MQATTLQLDAPTCKTCGDCADYNDDACAPCAHLDAGRITEAEWDAHKAGRLPMHFLQRRIDSRRPIGQARRVSHATGCARCGADLSRVQCGC